MKKIYLLAAALAVLLLSAGCLGGQDTESPEQVSFTESDALSIQFWTPSSEYIANEGTQAVFNLEAENTGTGSATSIKASLFGASWVIDQTKTKQLSDLRGVDLAGNTRGGIDSVTWNADVTAADVPPGSRRNFTVGVRVTYGYEANAGTSITLMGADRFRNQDPTRHQVVMEGDGSPLSIKISQREPIRAFQGRNILFPLTIRNVGDGSVSGPVPVTVTVDGEELGCTGEYELFGGERQITCSYQIEEDIFERDVSLNVEVPNFRYVETEETQFAVRNIRTGSGEEGTSGNDTNTSGPPAPPS